MLIQATTINLITLKLHRISESLIKTIRVCKTSTKAEMIPAQFVEANAKLHKLKKRAKFTNPALPGTIIFYEIYAAHPDSSALFELGPRHVVK